MTKAFFPVLFFCIVCSAAAFAQSAPSPQPPATKPSATIVKVNSTGINASGYAAFLKMTTAIIMVDTSIKVSPKMAYMSIDMFGITGSSLAEMMAGNTYFWVTDKKGNYIKIADKFLKRIKSAMETNEINFTAKIPYRIKTDVKNEYTVRFRWESKDRKKMIDFTVTK